MLENKQELSTLFGVKLTSTGKWILIQELKYLNIH